MYPNNSFALQVDDYTPVEINCYNSSLGVGQTVDSIIDKINELINNEAKKKVVFIHMMGTHHHYENRYPESFSKFNDEPKTNFKSEESFYKINKPLILKP